MSGKSANSSSMSMQSAKKRTRKTRLTLVPPAPPTTESGPVEVVSRPSRSPLEAVYSSSAFQVEWDNNVPFHIAENLVHLRRVRGMSQAEVADAIGTSQPAIARMESAQENNITLSTLQKLIVALKGRFRISISPVEVPVRRNTPWWELSTAEGDWAIHGLWFRQNDTTQQVLVGLVRPLNEPLVTAGRVLTEISTAD
jgi:transcriptional regulator with XRE-family HTH domain